MRMNDHDFKLKYLDLNGLKNIFINVLKVFIFKWVSRRAKTG